MHNGVMINSSDIKNLRLNNGWTQSELGERVGVDLSTIWRWENGKPPSRGAALTVIKSLISALPQEASK